MLRAYEFIAGLGHLEITAHVAQNDNNRRSPLDGFGTPHAGPQARQNIRIAGVWQCNQVSGHLDI